MDAKTRVELRDLLQTATQLQKNKDYTEALEALEQAFKLTPTYPIAARIAELLIIQREYVHAYKYFSCGLDTPREREARANLARCSLLSGDMKGFVQNLEKVEALEEINLATIAKLITAAARNCAIKPEFDKLLIAYLQSIGANTMPLPITSALMGYRASTQLEQYAAIAAGADVAKRFPAYFLLLAFSKLYYGALEESVTMAAALLRAHPNYVDNLVVQEILNELPHEFKDGAFVNTDAHTIANFRKALSGHVSIIPSNSVRLHDLVWLTRGTVLNVITTGIISDIIDPKKWEELINGDSRQKVPHFSDLLINYMDLNSTRSRLLSNFCDAISKTLSSHLKYDGDELVDQLLEQHREDFDLMLSDAIFAYFRNHSAFIGFLLTEKPSVLLIYADRFGSLAETEETVKKLGLNTRIFAPSRRIGARTKVATVGEHLISTNAGADAEQWRTPLNPAQGSPTAASGVSQSILAASEIRETGGEPVISREHLASNTVCVDAEQWQANLTSVRSWAAELAGAWRRTPHPSLVVIAARDRVYGPSTSAILDALRKNLSIFNIVRKGMEESGDGAPAKGQVWSEQDISTPDFLNSGITVHFDRIDLAAAVSATLNGCANRTSLLSMLALNESQIIDALDHRLHLNLNARISTLISMVLAFATAFAAAKPNAFLILPTRNVINQAVAREVIRSGVPCIEAMAVYMSRMPRYRKPVATKYLAIDSFSRDLLVDHFAMKPDQVEIIGSLRFESVLERLLGQPAPVKDEAFHIIVVTQAGAEENNERLIRSALNVVRRLQVNSRCTIKVHPAEPAHNVNAYNREVRRFKLEDKVAVVRDVDPYVLVMEADVVVSRFSNLVLEAAFLGTDAVILHEEIEIEPPVNFAEMGVAILARNDHELFRVIQGLVNKTSTVNKLNRTRSAYAHRNPLLTRPGSRQRAGDIIRKQIAERPTQQLPSSGDDAPIFRPFTSAPVDIDDLGAHINSDSSPIPDTARPLIVVEPTIAADFAATVSELIARYPSARILAPPGRALAALGTALGEDELQTLRIPYPAVDTANDDYYFVATEKLLNPSGEAWQANARGFSTESIMRTAIERTVDQVVPVFRLAEEITKLTGAFDVFFFLSDDGGFLGSFASEFAQNCGKRTVIVTRGMSRAGASNLSKEQNRVQCGLHSDLRTTPERLFVAPGDISLPTATPVNAIMFLNMADDTYLDTFLELLKHNSRDTSFGVVALAWTDSAEERVRNLGPEIASKLKFTFKLPTNRSAPISSSLYKQLNETFISIQKGFAAETTDPVRRAIGRFVYGCAARSLLRNVGYAMLVGALLEEYMARKHCDVLGVSPGRGLESRLAVDFARQFGIPSIDIQAGTFSASRRCDPLNRPGFSGGLNS